MTKLTRIDSLLLNQHSLLNSDDVCFYLGEYTARAGYSHSKTNNLIHNLKKSPLRRNRPEWRYKLQAINKAGDAFRDAIGVDNLKKITFVPVPPSKAKEAPEYDDRIVQILTRMALGVDVDIRELVVQSRSTQAAHESEDRPTVEDLLSVYQVQEGSLEPEPKLVAIVDDVISAGTHYRAMHSVISGQYPGANIVGLFVARRAVPDPELDFTAV